MQTVNSGNDVDIVCGEIKKGPNVNQDLNWLHVNLNETLKAMTKI